MRRLLVAAWALGIAAGAWADDSPWSSATWYDATSREVIVAPVTHTLRTWPSVLGFKGFDLSALAFAGTSISAAGGVTGGGALGTSWRLAPSFALDAGLWARTQAGERVHGGFFFGVTGSLRL